MKGLPHVTCTNSLGLGTVHKQPSSGKHNKAKRRIISTNQLSFALRQQQSRVAPTGILTSVTIIAGHKLAGTIFQVCSGHKVVKVCFIAAA